MQEERPRLQHSHGFILPRPPLGSETQGLLDVSREEIYSRIEGSLGNRLDDRQRFELVESMRETIGAMRDRRQAHHLNDLHEIGMLQLAFPTPRTTQGVHELIDEVETFFVDVSERGLDGIIDIMTLLRNRSKKMFVQKDSDGPEIPSSTSRTSLSLELGHVEQNGDWSAASELDQHFRALAHTEALAGAGYRFDKVHGPQDDRLISYQVKAANRELFDGTGCFVVVRKRPVADIAHEDGTTMELVRRSGFFVVPALFADSERTRHVVREWSRIGRESSTPRPRLGITLSAMAGLEQHLAAAEQERLAALDRVKQDIERVSRIKEDQRKAARLATRAALNRDDKEFRPGYFPLDTLYYARVFGYRRPEPE